MNLEHPYRTPAESEGDLYKRLMKVFLEILPTEVYPKKKDTGVQKIIDALKDDEENNGALFICEYIYSKPVKNTHGAYNRVQAFMRIVKRDHPNYSGIKRLFRDVFSGSMEEEEKKLKELGMQEMVRDRTYVSNILENKKIRHL